MGFSIGPYNPSNFQHYLSPKSITKLWFRNITRGAKNCAQWNCDSVVHNFHTPCYVSQSRFGSASGCGEKCTMKPWFHCARGGLKDDSTMKVWFCCALYNEIALLFYIFYCKKVYNENMILLYIPFFVIFLKKQSKRKCLPYNFKKSIEMKWHVLYTISIIHIKGWAGKRIIFYHPYFPIQLTL